MSRATARLLYLARHAEPGADGEGLSPEGARQAEHLGRRLAPLAVDRIVHGPLPRAAETARIAASRLDGSPSLVGDEAAGDYVPHLPDRGDLPDDWAEAVRSFLGAVSEREASRGRALATRAVDLFAGPALDGRPPVDVVVTHAFTIGWLVSHALGAPRWRWFPPSQCHAGLTVIRYEDGRPPAVVVANDLAHLPPDLRWTGFPEDLRA